MTTQPTGGAREKAAREYVEHFIGQYAGLHGESRTISDEEEIEFVAKFFLKFADIIERAYAGEDGENGV